MPYLNVTLVQGDGAVVREGDCGVVFSAPVGVGEYSCGIEGGGGGDSLGIS